MEVPLYMYTNKCTMYAWTVDFTAFKVCVFRDTMHRASKWCVASQTFARLILLSVAFDPMTVCNLGFWPVYIRSRACKMQCSNTSEVEYRIGIDYRKVWLISAHAY